MLKTFYIICKNESLNIRKCIEPLLAANIAVTVLDSGSTDGTLDILKKYPVTVEKYNYSSHCDTYNELTSREKDTYFGIIDADMEVSEDLLAEIKTLLPRYNLIPCPIEMYWEGMRLPLGSLYPPKAIVFRGGTTYFEPVGHGERLIGKNQSALTKNTLRHNDLNPYSTYLETQRRYADKLAHFSEKGMVTWRDRLRYQTPLMIFISPFYSLFIKGGVFFKLVWIYALDRIIAESIMFRKGLIVRIRNRDK